MCTLISTYKQVIYVNECECASACSCLPSWSETFTACQGQSINDATTHIDLFFRIWSILFVRYWLIDESTELLNSKAELKLGSQTRTRHCGT